MMRALTSLLLALMLALTSQSMAVARGASAATGQMVLCTGSGPVAVYVDSSGKPTSAPHICPDSALNVVFGGEAPPLALPQRLAFLLPEYAPAPQPLLAASRNTPPCRAPPSVV